MKNENSYAIAESAQQDQTEKNWDHASFVGRPVRDELVPSRYALRVGEIDVLVVSDGVLPIPAATPFRIPTVRLPWLPRAAARYRVRIRCR